MTTRDFTDAKKAELLSIIDEVTPNDMWEKAYDFFYDVRIGDFLMSNYDTVSAYQREILDIKDTTKAQIDTIWENVSAVEANHLTKIQDMKTRIAELAAEFGRLAEVLDPNRPGGLLINGSNDALMRFFNENFDVEEAYDLYIQGKVFALMDDPEFSEDAWKACVDDAERQDFLNRFFVRVQETMGLTLPLGDIYFTNLTTASGKNHLGLFGIIKSEGVAGYRVQIDNGFFDKHNRAKLLSAIVHETRHAYQLEVEVSYRLEQQSEVECRNEIGHSVTFRRDDTSTPKQYYASDSTAQSWLNSKTPRDITGDENFARYISSTREYDAWSFAGQLRPNESAIWGVNPNVRSLITPSGHWRLPNAQ